MESQSALARSCYYTCDWEPSLRCRIEACRLKTETEQQQTSHQLFCRLSQVHLYCLATESPYCADFSLFWFCKWNWSCYVAHKGGYAGTLWLICSFGAAYQVSHLRNGKEGLCHIPVSFAKMWCSPSDDLNQTTNLQGIISNVRTCPLFTRTAQEVLTELLWHLKATIRVRADGKAASWESRAASEVRCLMMPLAFCILDRSQ